MQKQSPLMSTAGIVDTIALFERSRRPTLPAPPAPETSNERRTTPPPGRVRYALGLSTSTTIPAWPDVEVLEPQPS